MMKNTLHGKKDKVLYNEKKSNVLNQDHRECFGKIQAKNKEIRKTSGEKKSVRLLGRQIGRQWGLVGSNSVSIYLREVCLENTCPSYRSLWHTGEERGQ